MIPRVRAMRTAATLAVLAAALLACGHDQGSGAPGGDGLPTPRGSPDGAAWDALGWVRAPDASAAEVEVFDPVAARAAFLAGKAGPEDALVDARRLLVRTLGLPEDAASLVLVLKEREEDRSRVVRLRAAKVRTSLADVRSAVVAHGGVEAAAEGRPSWSVPAPGGAFVVAWADGWLLCAAGGHEEEIARALSARNGKGSVRSLDGLSEAFRDLPDSLPLQVEWGSKFGDFGTGVSPPRAAVISISAEDADTAVVALLFASEAERKAARRTLEEKAAEAGKAGRTGPARFGDRGRVLLMGMTGRPRADALARRARNDLSTLRALLRARREGPAGRFPTTAEGLAALATSPADLDAFLGALPKDPWGRPYHYVSPHPTRPEDVDLRSAGPDGQIDTEDDVFPED